MRRAISTASRPSPGAENSVTSPARVRSGGCVLAKRYRRSAMRSVDPVCSMTSGSTPKARSRLCATGSPYGTVTSTSGAARTSALRKSNSTCESHGTSSSTSGRPANANESSAIPWRPASKSRARSVADAASNCSSNRSSRTERSPPPSGSFPSDSGRTCASRSSCSVRASARGNPGASATGAKYDRIARAPRVERRAGRDGLRPEIRRRCQTVRREHRRREARGELRHAEPVQSERRRPRCRDPARKVIRRTARGGDDHRGPGVETGGDEFLRRGNAQIAGRGLDDAEMLRHASRSSRRVTVTTARRGRVYSIQLFRGSRSGFRVQGPAFLPKLRSH